LPGREESMPGNSKNLRDEIKNDWESIIVPWDLKQGSREWAKVGWEKTLMPSHFIYLLEGAICF